MQESEQKNLFPALAGVSDTPLRVAAFFRKVPDDGALRQQHERYSKLLGAFPKWTFIGCYAGQSAANKTDVFMGGYPQLLADCKETKIELIMVKSPHLLSRNIIDAIDIIHDLRKLKPSVGVYIEDFDHYSLHEDSRLFLTLYAALAEQESKLRSKARRTICCASFETNPLKRARTEKGMTQQEVADKAKISIRHYQMFEREEREIANASFRLVISVCDALDINPRSLLNDKTSKYLQL